MLVFGRALNQFNDILSGEGPYWASNDYSASYDPHNTYYAVL
jgi:hypothetical protein